MTVFTQSFTLGLACLCTLLAQAAGAEPVARIVPAEATRMLIWTEMVRAQDRARAEANGRFPEPLPHDRAAYMRWYNEREGFYKTKVQEYYQPIFRKYRIGAEHLKEISREGQMKQWPFPEPRGR